MKYLRPRAIFLILLVSSSSAFAQAPTPEAPVAPAPVPAPAETDAAASAPAAAPAPEPVAPVAAPAPSATVVPAPAVQAPATAYGAPPLATQYARQPSGIDPAFYRRNRTVAIVGKVLTVAAAALFIPYAVAVNNANEIGDVAGFAAAWYLVGAAGRLTWAGADLKMTNAMQNAGANIGRGPAITSMVFASVSLVPYLNLVGTPGTWIAGSIASARIREARDEMGVAQMTPTLSTTLSVRGFSTGVTLKF